MKLGYVLKEFPRLSETFILTELLALERLGCELTIFTRYRPTGDVPHAALARLRAEVVVLEPFLRERFWEPFAGHRELAARHGARHEAAFDVALAHRNREEMRYWLLAAEVARRADADGLTYLHGHFATGSASVARYASRILGLPFGFTAHAKDIYADEVDRDRLAGLLRDADAVVAISDANVRHLQELEPSAAIARVYNGIDLEAFRTRAPRPPNGVPTILFVSRFVEKKGIPFLLEALHRLRHDGRMFHARLVGDGPDESAARERVRELGLGDVVTFTGAQSQEQIVEVELEHADVFVLPCVVARDGDRDGIPTTILEAMARGVPVVSTRVSGVPEAILDGDTGLLAEPADAASLSRAIATTLDDPHGSTARVGRARLHVERRFDAAANATRLLEVFRERVAARTARRAR